MTHSHHIPLPRPNQPHNVVAGAVPRAWLVARLSSLRLEFEEAVGPFNECRANCAMFLADVCDVLGMTAGECVEVLGPETAAMVDAVHDITVELVTRAVTRQ